MVWRDKAWDQWRNGSQSRYLRARRSQSGSVSPPAAFGDNFACFCLTLILRMQYLRKTRFIAETT